MYKIIVTDNFSISMLPHVDLIIEFRPVPIETIHTWVHERNVEVMSAINNAGIATIMSNLLGVDFPVNKAKLKLRGWSESLYLVKCNGQLPKGATTLPDGTTLEFFEISFPQLICTPSRSEEHTSELQSHHDLVCRLLLEK